MKNNIPYDEMMQKYVDPSYNPYVNYFKKSESSKEQALEFLSKYENINVPWYEKYNIFSSAKIEPKIQDILKLNKERILHLYDVARNNGLTHNQFMEARDKAGKRWSGGFGNSWEGMNLNEYIYGLQRATHKQLMEVNDAGYNLKGYNEARRWGVSHNKCMECLQKRIPITLYGWALKNGVTHNEVLDVKKKRVGLERYTNFRNNDFSHDESLEYAKSGINANQFRQMLNEGKTDADKIQQAKDAGLAANNYIAFLFKGATHDELMDMTKRNISIDKYNRVRTDNQPWAYKFTRNHEDALYDLDPNYNPYAAYFNKSSSRWFD